jgi:hypothetical protein
LWHWWSCRRAHFRSASASPRPNHLGGRPRGSFLSLGACWARGKLCPRTDRVPPGLARLHPLLHSRLRPRAIPRSLAEMPSRHRVMSTTGT